MRPRLGWFVAVALLLASRAWGQASRPAAGKSPPDVPKISARSYADGSAKVTVTGGIRIDAEVPLNHQASYSDGEMTWLQFGASGSKEPNALITYQEDGIGVNVGLGRQTATAEGQHCAGNAEVGPKSISGKYTCKGVTSYDAASGKMSTVEIVITFSARS